MSNPVTLHQYLDSLSPEDRDKAIGILFGFIPTPASIGMMKRTTIKISSLAPPRQVKRLSLDFIKF
jgi:hypothetical protein